MGIAGTSQYPQVYYEDMHITESQKSKEDYLVGNIDHWISSMVKVKSHIKTYRDYYNGIRDKKDFEYLTDNFGIGTPSTLKFTNLIKPRVDSLVSQLESDSYNYSVSCTDDKTIDLIQENKKAGKLTEINAALSAFSKKMEAAVAAEEEKPTLTELKSHISTVEEKFSTNFLSDFEIAAQRVCVHFERSNTLKLRQKLAILVHDLIVTGECYYRVYFTRIGADPELDVVKPENLFHNKNTNTPFLDETDAVVHREYLTHKEVAAKYGKFMSADQITALFGEKYMSRTARNLNSGVDLDIYYSEDDPVLGQRHHSSAYTVEVMHVEWLATNEVTIDTVEQRALSTIESGVFNKVKNKIRKQDRYEGTRIGGTFYVNCGKSAEVARTQADPYSCGFSYGGVLNNDRGGNPYSIVGALKDLQDTYDITMFYRENLVANSGVPGDRVNVAGIPKVLGTDFMSRLMKFIALKKNGLELIDPTEQGAQLFQHYGSYDNTVNGNALNSLNGLLQSIEVQADTTSGSTPAMRGVVEQRDAVSNVAVGIKQALASNNSLFELFRSNQTNVMLDLISMAQVTFREGKKVSYVLGSEAYAFSILPDNFSFTDYAVSISYASKDAQKLLEMKSFAKELIAAQLVEPDVMTKAILSDSITEVSRLITDNWRKKKAEINQLQQASGQIEQQDKQLKELQSELNNYKQQLEASKNANNQSKVLEVANKAKESDRRLDIEEVKVENTKGYNDEQIKLKREVVQLEREQLYLSTGSSKEIKNL